MIVTIITALLIPAVAVCMIYTRSVEEATARTYVPRTEIQAEMRAIRTEQGRMSAAQEKLDEKMDELLKEYRNRDH